MFIRNGDMAVGFGTMGDFVVTETWGEAVFELCIVLFMHRRQGRAIDFVRDSGVLERCRYSCLPLKQCFGTELVSYATCIAMHQCPQDLLSDVESRSHLKERGTWF